MSDVLRVQNISADIIDDPHTPMRSGLGRDGLFDLADDIKKNGLINPITVRPVGERFEVVAGHRRLVACRIAGVMMVPCIVRELDDAAVFEIMTAENLSREDVPLLDECMHYQRAIQTFGKSIAEVAVAARRSVGYVEARLAIAGMPDYMQQYLQDGSLKLGAALALAQITDEAMRRLWVDMAVRDGVSVAQAEYWLQGWKLRQLPGGVLSDVPPSGFESNAAPIVQFECAVDGKKYDARLFRTLLVYEGNVEVFNAFVSEWRKESSETAPPSVANT